MQRSTALVRSNCFGGVIHAESSKKKCGGMGWGRGEVGWVGCGGHVYFIRSCTFFSFILRI